MNLYKITPSTEGYETYDGFVVRAENEEQAIDLVWNAEHTITVNNYGVIEPWTYLLYRTTNSLDSEEYCYSLGHKDLLKVELLDTEGKSEVILSSFMGPNE